MSKTKNVEFYIGQCKKNKKIPVMMKNVNVNNGTILLGITLDA